MYLCSRSISLIIFRKRSELVWTFAVCLRNKIKLIFCLFNNIQMKFQFSKREIIFQCDFKRVIFLYTASIQISSDIVTSVSALPRRREVKRSRNLGTNTMEIQRTTNMSSDNGEILRSKVSYFVAYSVNI